MHASVPRLLIAGTNSGCGKTTVTCAILQALVNRKKKVGAFKCGPDYIDPMFHSRIIGAKSASLDLFFFGENTLRCLLARDSAGCDVSIIEGVMGFYDGMGLDTTRASSYELAKATDTPVVLVVNVRGLALSVLAIIRGFLELYPDNRIAGVILNQCSAMTYPALAEQIRSRLGIESLGFLPPMPECSLESRHLGLVTAAEVADLREKMQLLARQAEKSLDLNGILALASGTPEISWEDVEFKRFPEPVRIGVARDKAFCFYYEDSLDALRDMGAELVEFSPLEDQALPENLCGLYLGGGYPELYAEALSRNTGMLDSVRQALARGLPCIAECGGFLYLTEKIGEFPMVGAISGESFDNHRLTRFGYVTLTAKRDNMLCSAGETIAAHEFHHWDTTSNGAGFEAKKPSGRGWDCVHISPTLYAGFPHFHFYSNPAFAENFYRTCLKEKHHD